MFKIAKSQPPWNVWFIVTPCLEVSVTIIIANMLTFLIGTAHIKHSTYVGGAPTATKHALHASFTYVHGNVLILLGKSRLRALAVLIFARDSANSNSASAVQTGLWLDK